MAGKESYFVRQWQRLSARERVLAGLTSIILISALLHQTAFTSGERSLRALADTVAGTEREILDLTARIADLRARANEIKEGRAPALQGRQLVDERGVVILLEDVSAEARSLGVNLVSIHPSQEIDKEKYKEVSMNLDLKARYREIGEYFKRLENLARLVNVRRLRMEACPDASSVCQVQVEAVTYMAK
jgi:Tfp pilus assembly protein PilO